MTDLPAANAFFNSLSALCLIFGYVNIRRRNRVVHKRFMLSATVFSTLFLISYITYHYFHGDTKFPGHGIVRLIYFFILITHISLSMVALPLILGTLWWALRSEFRFQAKHALACWTFLFGSTLPGHRSDCVFHAEGLHLLSWDTELYEARHNFVWRMGEGVVDLLQPRAGERILDLGCGPGQLTQKISESGAQVVGVDSSPSMIGCRRAALPELALCAALMRRVMTFDTEFDAAVLQCGSSLDARPGCGGPCCCEGATPGRPIRCGDGRKGKHPNHRQRHPSRGLEVPSPAAFAPILSVSE